MSTPAVSDSIASLADFLACPQCGSAPLSLGSPDGDSGPAMVGADANASANTRALECGSCGQRYPQVGGVPCLMREPSGRIQIWRENLGAFHVQAEQGVQMLEQERRLPGILPLTRERLEAQVRILRRILDDVDGLLVGVIGPPLQPTSDEPGFESRESLRSLFRDWGWHDSDENARALACVERVISAPLGRTLVLGAGACRLAYDLARKDPSAVILAVDDDPLVLLPTARILRGETLSVIEARPNATDLSRLSAVRELRTAHGPATRVFPLLADGLAPPVRDGVFDTVITPWFIDVVPPDLRDLLGQLRRVLAPGGRWLHFGPLLYPPNRTLVYQYSREEVLELARRCGFSVQAQVSEMLPFSVSPLGDEIRLEPCFAFWAPVGEIPVESPGALPSWIVLPHLPVPDFIGRALFFDDSPGFRRVIGLVDGARSINEIAATLGAESGTDPARLKDAVRQCLLEAHPDCRPQI